MAGPPGWASPQPAARAAPARHASALTVQRDDHRFVLTNEEDGDDVGGDEDDEELSALICSRSG
jgi:hypothetical protein